MAVEIERGRYFFTQKNKVEEIMNKRKVVSTSHSPSPKQPETLPDDAVVFNPLHDHESVWWITCWALLHYIPANHNPESDEQLRKRIEFARRIFHPTVFAPERNELLSLGLPSRIAAHVPSEFEWLLDTVSLIQNILCHHYKIAEADLPEVDEKAFHGVWQSIYTEYDTLAKCFEGLEVKMVDLKVEKQKFDTVEDEDISDMDNGCVLNNKQRRVD
jgi:hypothetical protein